MVGTTTAPGARTRLTESLRGARPKPEPGGFDGSAPENVTSVTRLFRLSSAVVCYDGLNATAARQCVLGRRTNASPPF